MINQNREKKILVTFSLNCFTLTGYAAPRLPPALLNALVRLEFLVYCKYFVF